MTRITQSWLIAVVSISTTALFAADPPQQPASVATVAAQIRPSLVTIRAVGRDNDERSIGTGFVIDSAGLIATNFHVIGDGRSFTVQLADDRRLNVVAVEASERTADLAVIRVDVAGEELPSLRLAESPIAQGDAVIAMGNPLGLERSVVQGIVSAIRDVEGREMIQLAMPIEPGNSGGPLVDMRGHVHGIINMKSAIDDNLAFAIPVAALRTLVADPNPIAMERWVQLASVDRELWLPLFGANWKQRGGQISVDGTGVGFGGRSLCLRKDAAVDVPFELAVSVKLDDESGAAGLVFHSDGGDRHYGFYPSGGKLRLSRFDGPSVYSWNVLAEVSSNHYLPGQWNELKVSVTKDRLKCYVNGQQVIESDDQKLRSGAVGLANFRATEAEFRRFRIGNESELKLSAESLSWLDEVREQHRVPDFDSAKLEELARDGDEVASELIRQANQLEIQAKQMRTLAADVRVAEVAQRLHDLMHTDPPPPDQLLRATLEIAALDDPDLDVQYYLRKVTSMADEVRKQLQQDDAPESTDAVARREVLDRYLFQQSGFHGSRDEYYHRANSHMNRVIDDREGLPITLTVLYMELARQLNLDVRGIGLPGHFIAQHVVSQNQAYWIDVFEDAVELSDTDITRMVLMGSGRQRTDADTEPQSNLQILTRVLNNLIGAAQRTGDVESLVRYTEALVALEPSSGQYRMMRVIIRHQTSRDNLALDDLQWLLDHQPVGIDMEEVQRMKEFLDSEK